MGTTKLIIHSDKNYMKQQSVSGSAVLTLPGFGLSVIKTVIHNLSNIRFFEVFADIDDNGIIWYGDKVNEYTETSLTGAYPTNPELRAWINNTVLTIELVNNTNPLANGNRTVYWTIYYDYGTTP